MGWTPLPFGSLTGRLLPTRTLLTYGSQSSSSVSSRFGGEYAAQAGKRERSPLLGTKIAVGLRRHHLLDAY